MSEASQATPAAPIAAPSHETPEASANAVEASIEAVEPVNVEDSSDSELQDQANDPNATKQEKQEAKQELKRRIKLSSGKEREIDFSNESELRALLEKNEGADRAFQESAKMRKQVESLLKAAKDNPFDVLKELGHDPDALTEAYMKKRIEEMAKSPEQLEMEKLRKELDDRDKKLKDIENEKLESEKSRVQEEYSRQLDNEITEALSSSQLPKSPYVVKRLAENLIYALNSGYDVGIKEILPSVEKQIKGEIRDMFEALPEDVVEAILGDNVSTKLRKRRLAKMKTVPETAASVKSTGISEQKAAEAKQQPDSKQKATDFWKSFGK